MWFHRIALSIVFAWSLPVSWANAATEIWLSGVDPYVRQALMHDSSSDYNDLFLPNAPWRRAAARVSVFETSTQYLANASDRTLQEMFADLRHRKIALAVSGLMIPLDPGCGGNVEGYSSIGTMGRIAARIKRLGGALRYVAMDEPLWYGHAYEGRNACRYSIVQVASKVAGNVEALKRVFPDVMVGDIEPLAAVEGPSDWPSAVSEFASAYQRATGMSLAFFQADIDWNGRWQSVLRIMAGKLSAMKIPMGIIYDGDAIDIDDISWVDHAEQRFTVVEQEGNLVFGQAILATWMRHPTHMLPEAQPGTMTNLVLRYVRPLSHLTLMRNGDSLSGRLTDKWGAPIAHAVVSMSEIDLVSASHPTNRTISGLVPLEARSAIIALRMNSECNGCSGNGVFILGSVSYQDGARVPQLRGLMPGGLATRVHITAGQSMAPNSVPFPVVPGSLYSVVVSADASSEIADSGYVALIFLDGSGKGVGGRRELKLAPSKIKVADLMTNDSGKFKFTPADNNLENLVYCADFEGNDARRSATAMAP